MNRYTQKINKKNALEVLDTEIKNHKTHLLGVQDSLKNPGCFGDNQESAVKTFTMIESALYEIITNLEDLKVDLQTINDNDASKKLVTDKIEWLTKGAKLSRVLVPKGCEKSLEARAKTLESAAFTLENVAMQYKYSNR